MAYCDFHTHLDFYAEIDSVLSEIEEYDILSVSASMGPASYFVTKQLARGSSHIVPCFGLHPNNASELVDELGTWDAYFEESPILAEIGLDYFWTEVSSYPAQNIVFNHALKKAADFDKFVVLHTKGAEADILRYVKRYNHKKIIVHWYSGPKEEFRELIEWGAYFTFGVETSRSAYLQELLREVPTERLLAETDNPVGEEWLSGKEGRPRDIIRVYRDLASILNLAPEELKRRVTSNALEILKEGLKDEKN